MKIKNYLIGVMIIIIDQITKFFVIDKNIEIIPNLLDITYTKNYGIAFGIGKGNIIAILNIIFIVAIIIYMIIQRKNIKNYTPYFVILRWCIWKFGR